MSVAVDRQSCPSSSLRKVTEIFAVASIMIAALMLVAMKVPLDLAGIPTMAAMLGVSLLAATWFRLRSSESIAADALSSMALIWLAGLSCGFTSLLGLRARFPVVDAQLLAIDRAFYIDVLALSEFIAFHAPGLMLPLRTIYGLSLPALFVCILIMSLLGERRAIWRATFGFVAGLVITCVISIFTPAKGSYVMAGPELLSLVPSDAGRYAFETFDTFYSASPVTLGLGSIQGVVCFPSFHTIVALLTAALWKGRPVAFGLACGWCGLVLISTIPIGGHYVIDLVAGAVVWALVGAIAARIEASTMADAAARGTSLEAAPERSFAVRAPAADA